jgi:protein O-mannosyl-transferase
MKSGRLLGLVPPVLIVAIVAVTFWPGLRGEFLNWDDGTLFTRNLDYRGLGLPQFRWMFTTTLAGHYMPLTWLTLGLNYVVGGMDPWGYHFLALLLHSTNAVLFYVVACRLLATVATRSGLATPTGDGVEGWSIRTGALVAALAFALHPQRVESVAWVTERGTLVSSGLYLFAVLAYLNATESGPALRWRWWGITSVASFAAALLAKGMVITLPATLLLLDIYPLRRWSGRWRSALGEKVPYAIVALIGAVIVLYARMRAAHWSGLSAYGMDARLAFAGYSFWFYPSSLIWPIGLSPLYEVPMHASLLQWRFLTSVVGLIAVTTILVVLRYRFPGGLAAWINSALVVAPVSGIAHSGSQLVSDRYSYLAALGFALIAGYAVGDAPGAPGPRADMGVDARGGRAHPRTGRAGSQRLGTNRSLARFGNPLAVGCGPGPEMRNLLRWAGRGRSVRAGWRRGSTGRVGSLPAPGHRSQPEATLSAL